MKNFDSVAYGRLEIKGGYWVFFELPIFIAEQNTMRFNGDDSAFHGLG